MIGSLKNRLKKLEAYNPPIDPLAELTEEEVYDKMFSVCQSLHEIGIEPISKIALMSPKCRKFFTGTPWLLDHNHRLDVFLQFKGIIINQALPNKERIEAILNLGWRNIEINKKEIDWLVSELEGVDMGEEKLWLRDYLELSGDWMKDEH